MSEVIETPIAAKEPLGFGQAVKLMNKTDKLIKTLSAQQQQAYLKNCHDLVRMYEVNIYKPSEVVAYKLYAQADLFSKNNLPGFDPAQASTIETFQKNGLLDRGHHPVLRSVQQEPTSEQRKKDLKNVGLVETASRIWHAHFGYHGS